MHHRYFLTFLFIARFISAERLNFVGEKVAEPFPFPHQGGIHYWEIKARIKDKEVGTARLQLNFNRPNNIPSVAIYIHEHMRNLKIGMILFEQIYNYARSHGYTHVKMCSKESAEGFNFLKKLMKNYTLEYTQHEENPNWWIVIVEVKD